MIMIALAADELKWVTPLFVSAFIIEHLVFEKDLQDTSFLGVTALGALKLATDVLFCALNEVGSLTGPGGSQYLNPRMLQQPRRPEVADFRLLRSLLCERLYEMTKEPQYGRRDCQQFLFFYGIGRFDGDVLGQEGREYGMSIRQFIGYPLLRRYSALSRLPHGFQRRGRSPESFWNVTGSNEVAINKDL
jgi:hypothetical protein